MELSFSSERAEYDDDPTAQRSSTGAVGGRAQPLAPLAQSLSQRPSPSLRSVAPMPLPPSMQMQPLPVQRPLQVQGGWGAGSMASPAPLPPPPAAAAAAAASGSNKRGSNGGGSSSGGGGFFASFTRPKLGAAAAPAPARASETEQIQAFDPTEAETSRGASGLRRGGAGSPPGTPSSVREHRRQKAERVAAQRAREKERENTAPGAIDDDEPSSARKQHAAGSASVAAAAPKPGGGGGGQSMIADLGRRGGKGAFALSGDLDFSSDEEEEGAAPGPRHKKKGEKKSGASGSGAGSSGDEKQRQQRQEQEDVAPLINDVALDFVVRRWASTLLGGMIPCWSAQPPDERQPTLPAWVVVVQLVWMVYPVLVGLVCNALYYHGVIAQEGVMALVAGVVVAALHLVLHLTHRSVVRRPAPTSSPAATRGGSTRVADLSSAVGGSSKPDPSGAAAAAAAAATAANLDNYEALLQAQVKAAAARAGKLPKKQPAAKAKRAQEEEEDDASRPPGVAPKKPALASVDDSDDDESENSASSAPPLGLLSPSLWCFLISPSPRPLWRTLLHALLSGVLVAGATYFLEWGAHARQWSGSDAVTPEAGVYLAAAWVAFALCFYSLNIRPPVELAQWRQGGGAMQDEVNAPLMRCAYAGAIIVYSGVVRILATHSPQDLSQTALDLHVVLLVFFPILPLLFSVGALPPLDALAAWAGEQINVVLFGGSPAASEMRAAMFLVAHVVATVAVFLVWLHGSHSGAMLFAAGLAFLLSWNGIPLRWGTGASGAGVGAGVAASASAQAQAQGEGEDPDVPFASFNSRALLPLRLSSLAKLACALGACITGLVLKEAIPASTDTDLIGALHQLHSADLAFDLVALALFLGAWAASQAFRPYILWGSLRNSLYGRTVLSGRGGDAELEARPSCFRWGEALRWTVRIFLLLYVAFHQDADLFVRGAGAGIELDDSTHAGKLSLVAYSALLFRSFRVVWMQTPLQSLGQVLFIVAVNLATGGSDPDSLGYWHELDWSVRFLIAGFVLRRTLEELGPKVWFMSSLTHATLTHPKQRVRRPVLMRTLCALLLPYHIGLALLASFLGVPVIPLLGSPLFLLSFPRPQRIWTRVGGRYGMNESAADSATNGGQDTFFYQQMFPSIYAALDKALRGGGVGGGAGALSHDAFCAGEFFLLRLEPYLVWGTVLERGLGYAVVQLKGLELASTSCHTAEALRIDEVLESTLEHRSAPSFASSAPLRSPAGWDYSYEPRLALPGVRSFSITKNVLTGIIDDRDNLATLSATFMRTIAYEMRAEMVRRAPPGQAPGVAAHLPPHWTKPKVSNYDLQQLEERFPWPEAYISFLFSSSASSSASAGHQSHQLSESDRALFKRVVQSSFGVAEFLASDVVSAGAGGRATPAHVLSLFEGRVGSSIQEDYLLEPGNAEAESLKNLVVRAYRSAFKALYDCAALGSLEVLTDPSDVEQFRELHALLEEYERDWVLSAPVAGNALWAEAVRRGEKKLFSIGRSPDQAHTYTSLTLERGPATLSMAYVSGTSVRAFWSSLHLELMYFANDDDERYSIQAHEPLLRNLTVQASEPPFGYPVFSGLPTLIATD